MQAEVTTEATKEVRLTAEEIEIVADAFKREIDKSCPDTGLYPFFNREDEFDVGDLIVIIRYNYWEHERSYHPSTYTQPEYGSMRYGAVVQEIKVFDNDENEYKCIENESELWYKIDGYTNTYEWS